MLNSFSDIKERFTNYVLLLIVCLRNMEQFSWNPDHLWVLFPDVCMVVTSEIAVDIVKHAFITKFNDITADVYSEYRASLAFDLVSSRQKNAYTDYSDSVARRMGFIPLPLAVLLIRVVTSSIKVQGILSYACVILFYFGFTYFGGKGPHPWSLCSRAVAHRVAHQEPCSGRQSELSISRGESEERISVTVVTSARESPRICLWDEVRFLETSGYFRFHVLSVFYTAVCLLTDSAGAPEVSDAGAQERSVFTVSTKLISLKVLNSIVLLGKSCQYVKEAKMEEKLFNPPPTSAPSKPSNKSQNKCKPSQEENLSASVTSQPLHQKENVIPLLVTSNSDQFLTTPDGDEKDITQENSELKHRSSKKDLLEIDRFTICGNRID
ncbi:hypothetical protein J1605_004798 [Eschrichtius robustus]|uniref:Transmembrane anterior posterior transformation protein 1 n=1 Tax=Eschrichtius robustus TaxID=9764 RepID=A0AB34HB61_ESCRO|nr:hypothetical protein J1605_004798 [Eschrichtius robustus]